MVSRFCEGKMMKSIYFECQCHSAEHILRFIYNEEDKELYTEIYLDQHRNILKRILVAIKYIFNYKCKFGDFDCFLFKNSDIKKLQKLLKRIKE